MPVFAKIARSLLARPLISCEISDDSTIRESHFGQWKTWTRSFDKNWDGRESLDKAVYKGQPKVTRHLILIRHGQYDLEKKTLTDLGRLQSKLTGERLLKMLTTPIKDYYGEIVVKFDKIYHSSVIRAKETAQIIEQALKEKLITLEEDPMLAEGFPCLPQNYSRDKAPSKIQEESARIEAAFRKYVKRATDWRKLELKQKTKLQAEAKPNTAPEVTPESSLSDQGGLPTSSSSLTPPQKEIHEYTVIVCHQNVIRYFLCRSLQLPPEYWLRFRGDNCGITEIIIYDDGKASLSKFADVGHLGNDKETFH
jgi:serine/threonine-protein phosphatase PGAM5